MSKYIKSLSAINIFTITVFVSEIFYKIKNLVIFFMHNNMTKFVKFVTFCTKLEIEFNDFFVII